MNVDYFINLIEDTPEERFCVDYLTNDEGQHCINGLCGAHPCAYTTKKTAALQKVFSVLNIHYKSGVCVIDHAEGYSIKAAIVNNGMCTEYQQPTIKGRLLAALNDAKKIIDQQ